MFVMGVDLAIDSGWWRFVHCLVVSLLFYPIRSLLSCTIVNYAMDGVGSAPIAGVTVDVGTLFLLCAHRKWKFRRDANVIRVAKHKG